jgi:Zn-dependent metalloprotease
MPEARMHAGCRNPIHCIVPPYVLEGLAQNGTDAQRERALRALAHDQVVRAARAQRLADQGTAPAAAGATPGQPQRTIRDAGGSETTDGPVVRQEGDDPVDDVAVNEAYDGFGATYAFYWEVFQRDSIDDQGLPLVGVVHYGENYDNAFWDGQEMVFGDGDGEVFNRFTIALDVIGHELAHGVTEDEAAIEYSDQPGALNESLSDVAGSMVKQYKLGQLAADADWLIGAGLLTADVNGVALRSMKAPGTAYDDPQLGGKDPQPDHMDGYVQTTSDNGGVHINSGIPNHAFYLAAIALGGHSWEKAGRIWYEALRDPATTSTPQFADFAATTVQVAARLYGAGGAEAGAVADAWSGVGIAT